MDSEKGAPLIMSPVDRFPTDGELPPPAATGSADWRRNYRNIAAKGDHLLEHGIYGFNPKDPRAKPFISLRTQVLNALAETKGRVIAVTSPSAANGKSHVAANLACAISRVRETILIDLHLRRPVIGYRFGLPEVSGIGSYLKGTDEVSDLSFRVEDERLTIHAAGEASEDSSDLLLSPRLTELFSQNPDGRDLPFCIVDCPPVLEGDEMLLIARRVDSILFVVEEGRTTKHDLVESFRLLNGAPVLGTLLNKAMDPLASLHR